MKHAKPTAVEMRAEGMSWREISYASSPTLRALRSRRVSLAGIVADMFRGADTKASED